MCDNNDRVNHNWANNLVDDKEDDCIDDGWVDYDWGWR